MISLGIIGYGNMGKRRESLIKQYFPSCNIQWIYDPALNFKIEKTKVDGVLICTPDSSHQNDILSIANDNITKNVYVEKPFTHDFNSTIDVIKLLRDKNINYTVSRNPLFIPGIDESLNYISERVGVGNVPSFINIKMSNSGGNWVHGWRTQSGKGVLTDLGIHLFAMVDKIFGNRMPREIFAFGNTVSWEINAEDEARVILNYGNCVVTLFCSWNDSGNIRYIDASWNDKSSIVGYFNAIGDMSCKIFRIDGGYDIKFNPPSKNPDYSHIKDMCNFIDSIENNEKIDNSFIERTMYLLDRSYYSMKIGHLVYCEGDRDANYSRLLR